jgi:hypothetical protein
MFVMEQLTQQLPKTIQQFVRERKPDTPEKTLGHIMTYFRTRGLDETTWESKETFTAKKHGSQASAHMSTKPFPSVKTEGLNPSGGDAARNNRDSRYKNSPAQQSDGHKPYSHPKKDVKDIQCHNCKQTGHYSWQCVKVNVVALPGCDNQGKPPVMKRGKIGQRDHLWCMDSGADMCFVAEDLLPQNYLDGPPVHAKGAMHPDGKTCAT